MNMSRIMRVAALTVAVVAISAASPAVGATLTKTSPNAKAYAWSTGTNSTISVKLYTNSYAHADYYRAASNSTQRHLWNKSGINTTATSGSGSTIFKLRVCEWVPDNDDICSAWVW
jgi:hypothetical protein